MHHALLYGCLLAAALLSGCASSELTRIPKPAAEASAQLVVYREWSFNSGGVSMRFGLNGKNLVLLDTSEYVSFALSAGEHRFFVQGSTGSQHERVVSLKAGEIKCLRGYPNPVNAVKVLVPFAYQLTENFLIEESSCPGAEQLAKLKRVDLQYSTD